jgi:AraC family transcriptional regulator
MRPSDRASVGVALYTSPPYDLAVPALPVSRLSVTLTASRVSGGLDGDRQQVFESSRHALFLAPAGAAAHWKKDSPSRHLTLYFHAEALADSDVRAAGQGLDGEPLHNATIPGVGALADELLAELEGGSAWSTEATDSLGRLLLIKVARHCARQRVGRNPLDAAQLSRLTEHVQAHLSERMLVGDLAAVVGLSPNHFAHAYTTSTGQSPHQFVMAQRLQRAQLLLQAGQLELAQVAVACGFSSQQHMTQVMRKRLGSTPARYRRARQGAVNPGRVALVPD